MPQHRSQVTSYGIPLPPAVVPQGGRRASLGGIIREYYKLTGLGNVIRQAYIPKTVAQARTQQKGTIQEPQQQRPVPQQHPAQQKQWREAQKKYGSKKPEDYLSIISQYGRAHYTVLLGYRRATPPQAFVWREIEPYAIRYRYSRSAGRRAYLYGYCPARGTIQSYILGNISHVDTARSRPFSPKWTVEL
jgi:predicted DNA-binding transcriptional regulator YafY